MAERQSGENDFDDAERVRFSKKLDGYEAMGLEVTALRQLLDDDIVTFKETYLGEIRTQLEGGGEEKEEEPTPEEEPEEGISPEEEEAIAEEEADEELELELEGAGPEAALLAIDEPEATGEEAVEVTPDEDIRISFGEQEEPEVEEAPEEEEATEEEETPEEEEAAEEEEAPEEEEATEEEETPEEEEAAEEEEAPSDIEADEKIEEEPAEEADEAEIQVDPEEAEEEEPEEEEEAVEDEEALIVVASVVEEADEEVPAPDEETEILLSGIEPEGEPVEEPVEEVPEDLEEKVPDEEEEATPSKKVRPRPRPVTAPKAEPPEKARVKPTPATVKRRRGLSRGVIAIIVAAVVVIAGIGSYFMFFQNEDPIALFTWDPEEPTVGQDVGFDAQASYDPDGGAIAEYLWNFGDGSTGKGRYVEHSFLTSETFTVKLTVKDERGGEATTHRKVTVEPMKVSMEQPRVGDFFEYRVSGSAKVFNYAEGLITFKVGNRVYKVYEVDATDVRGTKTFDVTQMGIAVDGFMVTHDVRTERTIYDLDDISGNISTEASINPTFTGSMKATVDDDICLHWERSIRSTVTMNNRFSAPLWADVTTTEDGVFYGQLDGIEDTFSMDEFLRTTSFVSDDRDEHRLPVGGGEYIWQVQGMERVPGRQTPSIVVRVTMDDDTLEANHLVSFFNDVWLEPGLSQPAKNHMYTKGRQDGNQFEVNLTETLSSFSEGSDEATGLCSGDHEFSQEEENPESFIPLDLVPEQGGAVGHFKFSPEEALVAARADYPDLNIWLNNNPGAFFHLGNYTENDGVGQWVMSFGKKGLSEHYRVDVIGPSTSDLSTKVISYTDNQLPLSSQSGIGKVATLTHGLRLMKEEPNIASRCFPDQTPDWTWFTFNVTEGVNVLSLDPGSALSGAQETGYVYLLVSKKHNPEYKAALDATNGQILFSWTHSYTFDPFA